MAFKIEDGTGVVGANSYATVAAADQYLADRGRSSENNWQGTPSTGKQSALIAATDYIDSRWGDRFKGNKQYLDLSLARATLTMTAIPSDGDTVTIGSTVYTFNTALGGANSVLIGASISASIDNLANAVVVKISEVGVTHGAGTAANALATAGPDIGNTLVAKATNTGTPGNDVSVSASASTAAWSSATLIGGGDFAVPQPLQFPRSGLVDRDGVHVRGIPDKLIAAAIEYAVRSVSSSLYSDPVTDDSGRAIKRVKEKVGPIEEETEYEDGSAFSHLIKPYPAADRLLADFITAAGRVRRG